MQKENCKQIRIFYNKYGDGKDNYRETLMNISRVFDDKEVMRIKIKNLNPYSDKFLDRWKVLDFKSWSRVIVWTYKG